jgi:two-component system NtrC family sensor kinase
MKRLLRKLLQLVPRGIKDFPYYGEGPERYRLLGRSLIVIMCGIALVPLVLMTAINYNQFGNALREESLRPVRQLITSTQHSLEIFLIERQSTLRLIAREHTFQEISNQAHLNKLFQVLKQEFPEFIDLGLIDSAGLQRSYSGPYGRLLGKNYSGQSWFQEVMLRGVYISDVFLGYRKFPHFVIAIRNDLPGGAFYIVRATIDSEKFHKVLDTVSLRPGSDIFLINQEGVIQTPSRYHGSVLEKCTLSVPPLSLDPVVHEIEDAQGEPVLFGYAYLRVSPFILMVTKRPGEVMGSWLSLRGTLLLVFAVSAMIIFLVAVRTTRLMVQRIEAADREREAYHLHAEQAEKLASLGRLAAGVAHEINNPLAIINETAGLMKDLVLFSKKYQDQTKFVGHVESILRSVQRAREVTHRLLGFAKRMDVKVETIHLNPLIQEVLGFLEKEALHRNIQVNLNFDPDLPPIESDRGQLQQVFLNLVNNAFEAVADGGTIAIKTRCTSDGTVETSITDNGCGIPEDHLKHLFEPFFTSGKTQGTGLGLSIAYGIVTKCGGDIRVRSEVGKGSTFTVGLPMKYRLAS